MILVKQKKHKITSLPTFQQPVLFTVLLTEPPLVAIVAELKFSTVVSIKQATFVDFNIYVYIYV